MLSSARRASRPGTIPNIGQYFRTMSGLRTLLEFARTLAVYSEKIARYGNNFVLWGCLSGVYLARYTFYAETP